MPRTKIKSLPARAKVPLADTWDLGSLFASDAAWEKGFRQWERTIPSYGTYRGRLSESVASLAACLEFDASMDRRAERLRNYAFLKTAEDQTNQDYQRMHGRLTSAATRAAEAASFIRPEVLAIPRETFTAWLDEPSLQPYRLLLERLRRYEPHVLSPKEEQLLALQGEMARAAGNAFRQLLDADMKFGWIENEKKERVELGNATYSALIHSPQRSVREQAFHQYYAQFAAHENTLAATLHGSVQRDVYYARVRGYPSALEAALFPDNVPQSVYDQLISTVHKHLPALYRYYELRRRKMRLRQIHHYDTYVPILADLETRHSWEQATRTVIDSLKPLGDEYTSVLEKGLRGRWCDRYPNRGKQSGAFSCGCFDGDPYILMNFKPEVLDDVFTLTHEAGHSMHTYFSTKHQPFLYYDYTIFVAEVASTFNEQLLTHHLLQQAESDRERAYLINRELDAMRATIYRQTMFAEFEKVIHTLVESGEPLTVGALRKSYRTLLEKYFGSAFTLDDELELECLRIPHFYHAFYVYKYATGMSAAIALSQRVLRGGAKELDDYLKFLRGGCSQDPLDLLRGAGVDLEKPAPVNAALRHFAQRVEELEQLL